MLDELFSQGDSYLHRADPRPKLVAAFTLTLCIAPLSHLSTAMLALILSLSLVFIAQLPLHAVLHRLAFINVFTLFLWLVLPFTTPAAPEDILHTLGPLSISKQGIILVSLITIKSNAILLVLMSLAASSGITSMGHAMASLGIPNKFAMLLLFTWRYLHVIAEEYTRLLRAATMRGFMPCTSRHTYATYANLIGMVLVRSYDRSARVQQAMALRGFHGVMHRLHDFSSAPFDRYVMALYIALGLVLLIADIVLF